MNKITIFETNLKKALLSVYLLNNANGNDDNFSHDFQAIW